MLRSSFGTLYWYVMGILGIPLGVILFLWGRKVLMLADEPRVKGAWEKGLPLQGRWLRYVGGSVALLLAGLLLLHGLLFVSVHVGMAAF